MLVCLQDWTVADGGIFVRDLEEHPRFGAVPIFTVYPTGPGSYLIDFFAPVWIETIYQDCNANFCHTVFSPGETGGANPCPDPIDPAVVNCGLTHTQHSDDVEGITAFRMSLGMLHPDTQAFFPGAESLREVSLLN
jgi:hypothetical protein